MSTHDRAIQRFRLHLAALLALQHTLALLTAWGFLWGTAVLLLRALRGTPASPLLWGLAAVPLAVALGAFLARRRLPSRAAVRALLDDRGGYGGLLMAKDEVDVGTWEGTMPVPALPQVRWQGRRAWTLFTAAVGFVVLSFLVPQRLADLGPGSRLEIDEEILRLAAKLDLLRSEAVLDPSRAEALKEKLDQLARQSSAKDPAKTLEALDHLQKVLGHAARKSAESATRKTEQLARTEALAEAVRKVGGDLTPKQRREAMTLLSTFLREGGLDALKKHLDGPTAQALRKGTPDAEQLARMATALRAGKGDLARQVEKLHKAGLIDREALQRLERSGMSRAGALAESLLRNAGKTSMAELVNAALKGGPGSTRDPGAVPLARGSRGREGLKFREIVLPPSALADLKGSKAAGGGPGRPGAAGAGGHKPDAEARGTSSDAPASGALAGATPGGGSANTQTILPRHRAAVERYFERAAKGAAGR